MKKKSKRNAHEFFSNGELKNLYFENKVFIRSLCFTQTSLVKMKRKCGFSCELNFYNKEVNRLQTFYTTFSSREIPNRELLARMGFRRKNNSTIVECCFCYFASETTVYTADTIVREHFTIEACPLQRYNRGFNIPIDNKLFENDLMKISRDAKAMYKERFKQDLQIKKEREEEKILKEKISKNAQNLWDSQFK